jgi:predicted transcriptional regulator
VDTTDPLDRIANALGRRYRRETLVALRDRNPLTLEELARVSEVPGPPAAGGGAESETVRIELVHTHLPKLESLGYVSWNRDTGTVVKGERWEEIEPVLELFEQHADRLPFEFA